MPGFNRATFLYRLHGLQTGRGFKRVIQGLNINSLRIDAGLIMTGSTNPKRTAVGAFDVVEVTNNQTDAGHLSFQIPRDYDQTQDTLKVRLLAVSAGDTDTPTIDAALYRVRAGSAITADLDPTISAAVNNSTSLSGWVEIDCSSLSLRPGDAVAIDLTTSAHTTDKLYIYGLEVVYKSDLVYFDRTDRA